MRQRYAHLLTVGTSLLTNTGGDAGGITSWPSDRRVAINALDNFRGQMKMGANNINKTARTNVTNALLSLKPGDEFGYRKNRDNHNFIDRMPQELSYLWKFAEDEPLSTEEKDSVVMLCSDTVESKESAEIISGVLRASPWNQWFKLADNPCEVAQNVDAKTGAEFKNSGINNWMNKIREIVQDLEKEGFTRIYLNITGGYKGTVPYSTLAGMLNPQNVRITYLFEDSEEIITIPTYPVGLDFRQWHENALRLRMAQVETARKYFIPDLPVRNLIAPEGLSAFGNALREQYETQLSDDPIKVYSKDIVSRLLHPEGPCVGGGMPDGETTDWDGHAAGKLREILHKMIDRSGDIIWLGDKIPEMVDHAQRHHHDLLEFTELFLSPIFFYNPVFMNAHERFVLLSAVLLHDSGHALDMLSIKACKEIEAIFGALKESGMPDEIPLFPCDVRGYHQYLAGIRLNDREMAEELGWPGEAGLANAGLSKCLHNAVIMACLYHRRSMDYDCLGKKKKGLLHFTGQMPVPLKSQTLDCGEEPCEIDLMKVVAFLRIIDGCDSQARRAGPAHRVRLFLSILKRDYRTATIRCREAYDAFKSGPEHEKKADWQKALVAEKNDDRGYISEPFCLKDENLGIRKECLQIVTTNGNTDQNLKQSARLWLMAAENADRAKVRFDQWFHFLKHQAVAEIRVIPDDAFKADCFKFHVILVPENSSELYQNPHKPDENKTISEWLDTKIGNEPNDNTLRKEIEEEVSGEFKAVQVSSNGI